MKKGKKRMVWFAPVLCMMIAALCLSACKKEEESIPTDAESFMKRVISLMDQDQYTTLRDYDGAEVFDALLEEMLDQNLVGVAIDEEGNRYEQAADGTQMVLAGDGSTVLNKKASAIYFTESHNSYFYCGTYEDGHRSGTGKVFWRISNGYEWCESGWMNDAPNGDATFVRYAPYYIRKTNITRTVKGNLTDGLWDGEIDITIETDETDRTYQMHYTAIHGQASENMWMEYLASYPEEEQDADLCLYAFATEYVDGKSGKTVQATTAEDAWYLTIPYGELLGTIGYGE